MYDKEFDNINGLYGVCDSVVRNDLQTTKETLNNSIETLNNSITEINSNITNINNKLESVSYAPFDKRSFIFIGDSYNADLHIGWGNLVRDKLGLTENVNCWVLGRGGFCFGSPVNNYTTLLDEVLNKLTSTQKNEITDIVINGSINDYGFSKDEIAPSFNAIQDKIKSQLPNARYWIINLGWSYQNDTIRTGTLNAINAYFELNKYAKIVNSFSNLLDPYFLESDMTHPTSDGMDLIADSVINILQGGNEYLKYYKNLNSVFSGITITGEILNNGYHIFNHQTSGITVDSITLTDSPTLITSTIGNNNLFMRECTFNANVLYRTNSIYAQGTAIITVKKRDNAQVWDLYLTNNTIVDGSFTITNVLGIYLLFDVYVDLTSN